MNLNNLRAEIARCGMTNAELIMRMGISKKCFYSRLKGATTFKQDEIQKIAEILNLNKDQIMSIFFTELVS